MMKLTNGEIFGSKEALSILAQMELPVKTSFGIAKLAVKLSGSYQAIDDVRNGLIKTYGEAKEDGQMEIIPPNDPVGRPKSPNWEKFVSEYNELMAQTVEVVIDKVKLPAEVDGHALQIAPNILMALEKFVTVE